MRLPSLKFLRTFQIAATRLSFKAAAQELCITASAVSHQIKVLEDQLGIALFERGPNSLSLTEAGRSYLQQIEGVFSRLEAVTEQLQAHHGRNVVRLNIPPFFASELLLPRLPSFVEVRPDTHIHINTASGSLQKHPEDADLSIVVGVAPEDNMEAYRLFAQTFVPACSRALLEKSPIAQVEDLNDHTLLVHEARRDGWERWTAAIGAMQLRPKKVIRLDSMQATAEAAEQGVGIALVSSQLGSERFLHGSLVKLFDVELEIGESYFLIHRPEDGLRAEIQALKRWILAEFQIAHAA